LAQTPKLFGFVSKLFGPTPKLFGSLWPNIAKLFGKQSQKYMPDHSANAVGESGIKSFDFGIKIKSESQKSNQMSHLTMISTLTFDISFSVPISLSRIQAWAESRHRRNPAIRSIQA